MRETRGKTFGSLTSRGLPRTRRVNELRSGGTSLLPARNHGRSVRAPDRSLELLSVFLQTSLPRNLHVSGREEHPIPCPASLSRHRFRPFHGLPALPWRRRPSRRLTRGPAPDCSRRSQLRRIPLLLRARAP